MYEILFVLLIGVSLIVYFLPSMIAGTREHHQTGAIFCLNLFAGWSIIGWIIAIVWACTNPPAQQIVTQENHHAAIT